MPRYLTLVRQGNTPLERARSRQGSEAERLYRSACDTYMAALQVRPGIAEALLGLGCARLALAAGASEPGRRRVLLAGARKALLSAEALAAPAACLNLACLSALEGEPKEARRWLVPTRKRHQLPACEQLLADPDLASLRAEPWFVELTQRG